MSTPSDLQLAELAGGFIHEIKNHLSTLGLSLQLLAEDFEEPRDQRERRALQRIQKLQQESQRLVDLSNDFLRFARIRDLPLVPTDLNSVVEEMVVFFGPTARTHQIDVKTYLASDLPAVAVHRDMFKQAILNLLLNALQAMPKGGTITLQTAPRGDGSVELSVIDTGAGMSAETSAKVFQPFFSTKPGGSGLGLATSKRIVEAHRGTIDLQSELDKGTKFTIRLPVAQGA